MTFTVRRARTSDAESIASLYKLFWTHEQPLDPLIKLRKKFTLAEHTAWVKRDLRNKNIILFVAEDITDKRKNDIAGFLELSIDKNPAWFKQRLFGHINTAIVHPKHRGKGILRALTNAALAELKKRNVKTCRLIVYINNTDAIRAWEKIGFHAISLKMTKNVQ